MIRVTCSQCGAKLSAKAEKAGARLSCPKCGAQLDVPFPKFDVAEASDSAEKQSLRAEWSELLRLFPWRDTVLWGTVVGGAILAMAAWSQPPSWMMMAGYVATIAATVTGGWMLGQRMKHWRWAVFGVSWPLAFWLCYVTDARATYTEREELESGGHVRFTKNRRGETLHGSFWWDSPEANTHISGGYSPSGKRHGQWDSWSFNKDSGSVFRTEWYWYGEEITEGDWSLRNQ